MEINLLAVLVAALASMVIGSMWYSPMLFGNIWQKYSGVKMDPKADKKAQQKMMLTSFGLGFLSSLVMGAVLAQLIVLTDMEGAAGGAQVAFWTWLGFVVTTQLGAVIWEMKSYKLLLIGASNMLVTLLVMGVILGVWPA